MDLVEMHSHMNGISFIEFAMSMEGWMPSAVVRDGKLVAIIKFNGPEFHFHSLGGYSFTRKDMMDEVFFPLWSKYGYAQTKTPIQDRRQQRFNERLGFRRIGETEHEIHYQFDEPRG